MNPSPVGSSLFSPDNVKDDPTAITFALIESTSHSKQSIFAVGEERAIARINYVNSEGMAAYGGQLSYDWRMPNIKELSTIVERACTNPARNTDIFPVTIAGLMWSSTLTLPWTGEWYSKVYTLTNNGEVWGTEVDVDYLDEYDNDRDPSKWRRVYAIRDSD